MSKQENTGPNTQYADFDECLSKLAAISDMIAVSLQCEIPLKGESISALDMLFGEQIDLLQNAGNSLYNEVQLLTEQSDAIKNLISAQAQEIELLNKLLDKSHDGDFDQRKVKFGVEGKSAHDRQGDLKRKAQKLAAGELRIVG